MHSHVLRFKSSHYLAHRVISVTLICKTSNDCFPIGIKRLVSFLWPRWSVLAARYEVIRVNFSRERVKWPRHSAPPWHRKASFGADIALAYKILPVIYGTFRFMYYRRSWRLDIGRLICIWYQSNTTIFVMYKICTNYMFRPFLIRPSSGWIHLLEELYYNTIQYNERCPIVLYCMVL